MIERRLEPEVMDDELEAEEYDQMDFTEVNTDFALLASKLRNEKEKIKVLDIGTGTGQIPLILADFRPEWQITAIDLAPSMLKIAERHIREQNKSAQITLELVDGKKMPYADRSFDLVMSNSLVHHIANPLVLFQEINRIVKPNGVILLRDLFRPDSENEIERIVQEANLDYSPRQKQLFKDSLRAALTVNEVQDLAQEMQWYSAQVYQSSSRHWTLRYVLG